MVQKSIVTNICFYNFFKPFMTFILAKCNFNKHWHIREYNRLWSLAIPRRFYSLPFFKFYFCYTTNRYVLSSARLTSSTSSRFELPDWCPSSPCNRAAVNKYCSHTDCLKLSVTTAHSYGNLHSVFLILKIRWT